MIFGARRWCSKSSRSAVCYVRVAIDSSGSAASPLLCPPSSDLPHQNQRPNRVPVFFSEKVSHESAFPIVRDVLLLAVLRANEVMYVVAEFVIQHISQMNFAEKGNPEARFRGVVAECLVNADFDPRRPALPRVVVQTVGFRFVKLAFARSYFSHPVPARKALFIEKNHAIESDQIFFRDRAQKSLDHPAGIKGWLVVAIGFDNTGLRICHRKNLTTRRTFRA